jgi:hypothetical protein
MLKALSAPIVGFVGLLACSQCQSLAQPAPCPPPTTLIAPDNPAYSDAMDLAKTLADHGFVVNCIFPTKLGSIFEVADGDVMRSTVEGEANFTTNYGAFDVIFMPKPQTFSDFKITEHREGGGYRYRFFGTPRVWDTNKFGTARRQYFLKHENHLFFVGDKNLRARLEEALNLPRETP